MLTASGGPFRGRSAAELADVTVDRGAGPSDVVDGSEDHHRLEHADEQGPRGDRGPRAVRGRLRPHRGRRPPPVDRPLDGRVHRRLDDRPAEHARHAPADRLRPGLPGAHRHRRSAGSTGRRSARSTSRRPTWPRSAAWRWPTRPAAPVARRRPGSARPTRWPSRRSSPADCAGRRSPRSPTRSCTPRRSDADTPSTTSSRPIAAARRVAQQIMESALVS